MPGPTNVYPNYQVLQDYSHGSMSRMFYLFVSANGTTIDNPDTSKPLILWLQGGPGCIPFLFKGTISFKL